MAEPNVPNATSAALLGLLHEGPMTGGQLVMAVAERYGTFFSVTRSQVYRELPAMTEQGLLRLGKRGIRSSQQYAITAAGRKAFRTWLTAPPESDQPRSPLILRLTHAGSLAPQERTALVAEARTATTARLDAARTSARAARDPYAKAAADFGVSHARAMLKLLDAIPVR